MVACLKTTEKLIENWKWTIILPRKNHAIFLCFSTSDKVVETLPETETNWVKYSNTPIIAHRIIPFRSKIGHLLVKSEKKHIVVQYNQTKNQVKINIMISKHQTLANVFFPWHHGAVWPTSSFHVIVLWSIYDLHVNIVWQFSAENG